MDRKKGTNEIDYGKETRYKETGNSKRKKFIRKGKRVRNRIWNDWLGHMNDYRNEHESIRLNSQESKLLSNIVVGKLYPTG